MTWEVLIAIISGIILINYFVLIVGYYFGLGRLKSTSDSSTKPSISIIIAARNEESSIENCLTGLALQDYPKSKLEIIIVNDQSTDNTELMVNSFISRHPDLNIQQLFTSGAGGKKSAVKKGIEEAHGEYIVVTDSDCTHSRTWISKLNDSLQSTGAVFVAGPVMMEPSGSVFSDLQCLEFNSLLASTAGSIGINKPIMCNGANMAFSREAYNQLKSNSMDERLASGDDVFLLFSMKEKYGAERIAFARSPEATTYTSTNETLEQFIQQRLRWASKSSSYKDAHALHASLTVFSMNFVLLTLLIAAFTNHFLMVTAVSVFAIKTLVDSMLISRYTRIFGQRHLLLYMIIAEPLIAIYTVVIGLLGNYTTFKWKDRKISRIKA